MSKVMNLQELLKYKIKEQWKHHVRVRNNIKNSIVDRYKKTLVKARIQRAFPGVHVNSETNRVVVYLTSEYNIVKDWALFVDNNINFLNAIGEDNEYTTSVDNEYGSVDYLWKNLSIWVNYNGANYTREEIGTEIIEKKVYKLVCN